MCGKWLFGICLLFEVELVVCFGVNCYIVCYVICVFVDEGFLYFWCGVGVFVVVIFVDYLLSECVCFYCNIELLGKVLGCIIDVIMICLVGDVEVEVLGLELG